MQRALVGIIRHTDIRLVYALMHIWLLWYVLVRPVPRNGAYVFHRRRGRTRFQAAVDVYRSFYHFGKAIVDRFAVYAGYEFTVTMCNKDIYDECVQSRSGVIMLFSHLGNTEMAGYLLNAPCKRMHILVYGGESPVVAGNRAKVMERNNIDMIIARPDDMSHIFRISEILGHGDVLGLAADRRMGDATLTCTFMGRAAQLPAGAFRICAATKMPVLLLFTIKDTAKSYRVFCERLDINAALPKKQQEQDLADRFARRLEDMAMRYPYQWFNMYDFWA